MDSEIVIDPPTEVVVDRGKRKRDDMLEFSEPQGHSKHTIHENGEGSGTSREDNQG